LRIVIDFNITYCLVLITIHTVKNGGGTFTSGVL
jgi:hypothetical protein